MVKCKKCKLEYRYDFKKNSRGLSSRGSRYEANSGNARDASSSHGIELKRTTDGLDLDYVHPELAAAAINPHEAIIQIDGRTIKANFNDIDVDKVELACNDEGCVLIHDDGNPYNDIILPNQDGVKSSHGFELNKTTGGLKNLKHVDPEIAKAAINPHEAIIQIDGKTRTIPISEIDVDKVELACNDDGCVLIPDDGNPYNDILYQKPRIEKADDQHNTPHSGVPPPSQTYSEPIVHDIPAPVHEEFDIPIIPEAKPEKKTAPKRAASSTPAIPSVNYGAGANIL